jgi:glycerate 2-kinase
MIIPPEKFSTTSLQASSLGNDICRVLSATIHSADAGMSIKNKLSIEEDKLTICGQTFDLGEFERIFILGAGKAIVPMAEAVLELLGNRISAGLVITKDGYAGFNSVLPDHRIEIIQAGHPVPDQRNLAGSSRLVEMSKDLSTHDLVICLLSGGGSSLLLKPSSGLSLVDIQETTSLLLSSGSSINEINTVRKHSDDLKGGGLAKILFPATVITLILSDVIGDRLDMVASGPTSVDPTTYSDAWAVLNKYQLLDKVPKPLSKHVLDGIEAVIPESVKPGDSIFARVHNFLVGNNTQVSSRFGSSASR